MLPFTAFDYTLREPGFSPKSLLNIEKFSSRTYDFAAKMQDLVCNSVCQYSGLMTMKDTPTPRYDLLAGLLESAFQYRNISILVLSVFTTKNSIMAQNMLETQQEMMLDRLRILKDRERRERCPQPDLERVCKLCDDPCFEIVFNDIKAEDGRLRTYYAQVRNYQNPCLYSFQDLCTFDMAIFKYLAQMGASAMKICNWILEFAGEQGLKTHADRLLRVDFLTDVEFSQAENSAWIVRASPQHREDVMEEKIVGKSDAYEIEQLRAFDDGIMYLILSPWDSAEILGFFITDVEINEPAASTCNSVVLWHIELTDQFRQCGVGTRVVNYIKRTALRNKFRELVVYKGDNNKYIKDSREFWDNLLFEYCSRNPVYSNLLHC